MASKTPTWLSEHIIELLQSMPTRLTHQVWKKLKIVENRFRTSFSQLKRLQATRKTPLVFFTALRGLIPTEKESNLTFSNEKARKSEISTFIFPKTFDKHRPNKNHSFRQFLRWSKSCFIIDSTAFWNCTSNKNQKAPQIWRKNNWKFKNQRFRTVWLIFCQRMFFSSRNFEIRSIKTLSVC